MDLWPLKNSLRVTEPVPGGASHLIWKSWGFAIPSYWIHLNKCQLLQLWLTAGVGSLPESPAVPLQVIIWFLHLISKTQSALPSNTTAIYKKQNLVFLFKFKWFVTLMFSRMFLLLFSSVPTDGSSKCKQNTMLFICLLTCCFAKQGVDNITATKWH